MGANREIEPLVLYDGVCKFCNKSVNFILDHEREKELLFTPLQSKLGQSILKKFSLPPTYTDSLIFVNNGIIYTRAEAVFEIADFLIFPWRWVAFLRHWPTVFSNFFYNLIAKHRYKLMGQSDVCIVPTQDTKGRFLE